MAGIVPTTGLISGLQTQEIINALVSSQNNVILRLQQRGQSFKSTQLGITALSARVLTLSTSAASLATAANFQKFKSTVSDTAQLDVSVGETAVPGNYQFQILRLASAQQTISRGFTDADHQPVGSGTLTIASGGRLSTDTTLDALNGGVGIRRGVIRITDRGGNSADVDLTSAATVTDVLNAINTAGLSITAEVQSSNLVLRDTSGQTVSNLIVTDQAGGHAADDLGIRQSVASGTLSGESVYHLTGGFTVSRLNDGNGLRLSPDQADLRIELTDLAGTTLEVDLSGATTLGDVVNRINSHGSNGGKLTAAISSNRLVLTDNTTGGGGALTVTNLNGSNAAVVLGLNGTSSGNTLNGQKLIAGLNSVLLRNVRGGRGIDVPGSVSLTDRTGASTVVDLSTAESLDEVLTAVNSAGLQLRAELNTAGNGIVIRDVSGQSASPLVITDVGGGTLAAQLGIEVNGAQAEVQSGSLYLRHVNESTLLAKYAPGGVEVRRGAFGITDSSGVEHFVNVNSAHKTLGDVLQQINTATGGSVTAELNDTGDGLVLIDQAGGSQQLAVRDLDGQTAADLRLLGTGTSGIDGKSRISGRQTTTITLSETDTLQTLADKLNASRTGLNATILDDGTAFSPKRLVLTSKTTGAGGRLVLDDAGLGLGLTERSRGQDALLRIGDDPASGFVVSKNTNVFDSVVSGLTLTAKAVGTSSTTVTVSRDADKLNDILKTLVKNFNDVVTQVADSTKFNATTNERGALQGEGVALRVSSALSSLANGVGFGPAGSAIRSLRDLGISLQADGKLNLDSAKFAEVAEANPQAVADFFLNETQGFAARLKSTVESFTNDTTGKLTAADKSAQASVDTIDKRIAALQATIELRKERLLQQFVRMEQILSSLNSQQSALENLSKLSAASK